MIQVKENFEISEDLHLKYETFVNKLIIENFNLKVLESDYNIGFIIRYFAKNNLIKNSKIIEIDFDTYVNLYNKNEKYPHERYTVVKLTWKITGPTSTIRTQKHDIPGIRYVNTKSVFEANKIIKGIDNKLRNLVEFARIDK